MHCFGFKVKCIIYAWSELCRCLSLAHWVGLFNMTHDHASKLMVVSRRWWWSVGGFDSTHDSRPICCYQAWWVRSDHDVRLDMQVEPKVGVVSCQHYQLSVDSIHYSLTLSRATLDTLRKHYVKVASAGTISFHYNQRNWLHRIQQHSKHSKEIRLDF